MLDLARHVPGGRVSTGLVGWWEDRLAWAVGQRKYWRERDGRLLVPVIGVGGGQEEGETLVQAVAREAAEEVDATAGLIGARRTLWARGEAPEEATPVDLGSELDGEPAPLLVWQVPVTLVRDDGTPYRRDYICAVYEAVFERRPRPTADTPGVFRTGREGLLALGQGPQEPGPLASLGSSYEGLPLPPGAAFFPQGSTLFVIRHWDRLEPAGPLRAWIPAPGDGAR